MSYIEFSAGEVCLYHIKEKKKQNKFKRNTLTSELSTNYTLHIWKIRFNLYKVLTLGHPFTKEITHTSPFMHEPYTKSP